MLVKGLVILLWTIEMHCIDARPVKELLYELFSQLQCHVIFGRMRWCNVAKSNVNIECVTLVGPNPHFQCLVISTEMHQNVMQCCEM